MPALLVPELELLDVFQMDDRPRVVLAPVPAVQEVAVHAAGDDAMGGQQIQQVNIARRRILRREWLPWTIRHSGNGPAPWGTRSSPLRGTLVALKGQTGELGRSEKSAMLTLRVW